jgi:hypothetical protein
MRKRGLTLQAIADTLNGEGVSTLRGGHEWRPSSVRAVLKRKRLAGLSPTTAAFDPTNDRAGRVLARG